MHYLQALVNTYNNNLDKVGVIERDEKGKETVLLPPYHSTRKGHIRVTLSENGELLTAQVDVQFIILPTTEDSGSRSGSAVFPHPLHDQIRYLTKDFVAYAPYLCAKDIRMAEKGNTLYLEGLEAWLKVSTQKKIEVVYQYLKKGTLTRDLIKIGILPINEEGHLLEKWTGNAKEKPSVFKVVESGDLKNAMVYFDVASSLMPDENGEILPDVPLWEDRAVHQSFETFYKSKQSLRGICYLTGEQSFVTIKHPKGLRHVKDGTKLISVNNDFMRNTNNLFPKEFSSVTDKKNGEMKIVTQPAAISAEASQKSHNMLRWLIQKQGIHFGNKYILVWGSKQANVNPLLDNINEWVLEDLNFEDEQEDTTKEVVAERLRKAFKSHDIRFEGVEEDVHLLILDSMGEQGRLQVLGYRQFSESDYLKRIESWQEKTRWLHPSKQGHLFLPSVKEMGQAIYGHNYSKENNASNIKRFYGDMSNCIIDGRPIPRHYIQAVVRKALNPNGFEGDSFNERQSEWKKTVRVACSMLRHSCYHTKKGIKNVKLDTETTDRDYLFGRLLAVAQMIEKRAQQTQKENRQTNAERYLSTYAQMPLKTWKQIYIKIQPYLNRLDNRRYYDKLLSEITCQFEGSDFSNKALNGTFLQGFALQEAEFYKKKEQVEEIQNSEEANELVLV